MRIYPLLLLTVMLVGCARTETYQVRLINKTSGPLTFGLVKQGEPFESKWGSPEDASYRGAEPSPETWGFVPAGKTAVSQPITGKFAGNAAAYLRVYQGKLDLPGIMAVGRGASNRLDLLLTPGPNSIAVTDDNGKLAAERGQPPRVP